MEWVSNSNVYLGAEAQPLPVSSNVSAHHRFVACNYNEWPAEITGSEVYVESLVGLTLVPPNGDPPGPAWKPGRLGVLGKRDSTSIVETLVRKDPGSWSAGEYVAVKITFQKAGGKKKRDLPDQAVPITLPLHVPIK
jgi:hypothetical protein